MAVNAQKAQQQIQRQMTKIMEKLSTGQRINKPNDDPAGLSISTKMTAQIKGFQAAAKNICLGPRAGIILFEQNLSATDSS